MDSMILSIFNVESFISIISVAVIIALIVFYISKRAGSSFGIINKLINIIFSSKEFHSDRINDIWHEREDIERFNALFNTRAANFNHIIAFDKWIKKYDLDLKSITNLGLFFDIKRKKIKKSPWYVISVFVGLTLFFFSISSFSFILTVSSSALIKLNKFDDVGWLWINSERAYAAQNPFKEGYEWRITKDSCKRDNNADVKLPKDFVDTICASFVEKEALDFFAELISNQNKMLFPTIMLVAFTIYIFSASNQAVLANLAREVVRNNIVAYRRNRKTKYIESVFISSNSKAG